MTKEKYKQYEQLQEVFLKSGKDAYKAAIPMYNNPYRREPFRGLWLRGYRQAERDFTKLNPVRTQGFFNYKDVYEYV